MIAMYLSKRDAHVSDRRATTLRLIRSGDTLAMLLLPVLMGWRYVYSHSRSV
jgi:hypothetical protein